MVDRAQPTLCWVLPDMSPYHHARIAAYARRSPTTVIEISDTSGFREFKHAPAGPAPYCRATLFHGRYFADIPFGELSDSVAQALDQIRPDVLLVQGWAETFALAPLAWAWRTRTPVVVASETQAIDHERAAWKEWAKRRLVNGFSAALVGGSVHVSYLESLGMPRERIFVGYDAIDNEHFATGADSSRRHAGEIRRRLNLAEHYFLASARFIPKKNHTTLLQAYADYVRWHGPDAWQLVLLGDGPERLALERFVLRHRLESRVRLPGFQGYDDLPTYYGLASAFVHVSRTEQWGLVVNEAMAAGLPVLVSNRCGCCPALVHDGRNGFTFDPQDSDTLSQRMTQLAGDDIDRAAFGRESRRIIADWSPERFDHGLRSAVEAALSHGSGWASRLTNSFLLRAAARRRRQHV